MNPLAGVNPSMQQSDYWQYWSEADSCPRDGSGGANGEAVLNDLGDRRFLARSGLSALVRLDAP